MRRSRILPPLLALALAGCVTHTYVGERYPPNPEQEILVFYHAIPEGYRIIGENRAEGLGQMDEEQVVASIVKKAREVGADAISVVGAGRQVNTAAQLNPRTLDDDDYREFYGTTAGQLELRQRWPGGTLAGPQTVTSYDKVVVAKFLVREE